jgi:hypothetical protein
MDESQKPVDTEEPKPKGQKVDVSSIKPGATIGPRTYITKTGKVRTDKLRPLIKWNNKEKGSYNVGKNAYKRAKKLAKQG